jgi:hypothetical protein
MANCHRCSRKIRFRSYKRKGEDRYTVHADGSQDTHYKAVEICGRCHQTEMTIKAVKGWARRTGVTPLNAIGALALAILAALALSWFSSDTNAQGQKTVDVMAVAPKATWSKPRLIPPEDRGAGWR